MATRQVYWNIEGEHWLYLLFIFALIFFGYGVFKRVQLWKLGKPENRCENVWQGIKDIIVYGFGHKRILKDPYPGLMHFAIFWGFVFLAFATAIITLQADVGLQIFHGWLYLFIKLTANLFGLAALIGILVAAYRRYIQRPDRLDNLADDAITLILLFVILLTGFLIEGVRMAALSFTTTPDQWASWGFVGQWISIPLRSWLNEAQLLSLHRFLWWFHLVLAMFFIGYFSHSKLFHVLLGPANQFMRNRGPIGIPETIDFEDESIETFGKSQLREFSWKALFNTDACLRCGRCQDNCPAYLSGKHLSPKRIIQDMKVLMQETGAAVEAAKEMATSVHAAGHDGAESAETEEWTGRALIGEVIPEEDLWACTTCRSCEQQCPVFIEHVDKTIDMRRNLVLMETRFPSEAQLAFKNMENNGNPWGIGWSTRADFLTNLGVKTCEEDPGAEYLYWPGCSGAFDARNQKVSAALVKLLNAAGVRYAILGNEEKCCGDSARKLGNEYLFYSLASENIEVMKGHGVKKIITQCPHCYNLIKNEYPQFGCDFEVIHHTVFLLDLIKSGKLKLSHGAGKTVTYHDSCYLGRYNQIYEQPRELLKTVGLDIKEMAHTGEKSFCCGAGGGRMWLEEHEGQRINEMRTDEAIALKTDYVGTACPFCLTMIADGIGARGVGEQLKALDIAEILENAL